MLLLEVGVFDFREVISFLGMVLRTSKGLIKSQTLMNAKIS